MKWFNKKNKVEKPPEKKDYELDKKYTQLLKDLEYWHRTFRTFSVMPCAHCKKQMRIYPYGGAYYTAKNNQKVHAECYDQFLAHPEEAVITKDNKGD